MENDYGWDGTCRVLLGREIGPMENYGAYLSKFVEPYRVEKSAISGNEVAVSGGYDDGARFISGGEIMHFDAKASAAKLDINSIKDIDSVMEALSETIVYSGNGVKGKSGNVALSDKVLDSTDVFRSHEVIYSKKIAYCHIVKNSEYNYGGESVGYHAFFTIKGFEIYESMRVFEGIRVYNSSDCAYCAAVDNCRDCMFSFNLRSKSKCIGNLQLEAGKYAALKKKLLEDIAQTLEGRKNLVSLVEIIGGGDNEGN